YVRAYATNSIGTAYGNEVDFTTSLCNVDPPTVTTELISNITDESAQCGGNVTDEGGASVTARGVCWSTTSPPTVSDSHTIDGAGPGSFTSYITGLERGKRYFVRAYATNSGGTAYGNRPSFYTPDLPTVSTFDITDITDVSAQGGGNVGDTGGAAVTARGVCWNTSPDPDLNDGNYVGYTTDGTGTGSFTSSLTELSRHETYYVRAYATNMVGTRFGDNVKFTSYDPNTSLADYDGNVYPFVDIGSQTWMAENLKVTHYNNGIAIPIIEGATEWPNINEDSVKAYCWYENNASNGDTYGALYTWAGAMNGVESSDGNPSGVQGVCPDGWHMPSDAEWQQLEMFLGMTSMQASGTNWRGTDEGGKMKVQGTAFWTSPNVGATNESGFSAVPAGARYLDGSFNEMGGNTFFFTSTEYDPTYIWGRSLYYGNAQVRRTYSYKNFGFSVRCIKD
ncbi:MAG: fibrobacter succinogenes major paralogous domain-containing protein, partial [Bacteroidales bacterium]|nr:fibrobacter succinogenes major paralogous domain-containing protein [Bacteroidales bacterium]